MTTSKTAEPTTSNESTSSAVGSLVKTWRRVTPEELASVVLGAVYGLNSAESSTNYNQPGLWSKTQGAMPLDGLTEFAAAWGSAAMRRYRSRLRRDMLALPTAATESSLLPTLTATRYGTTNNGKPYDHRREYATKGTPSLWTMASMRGGQLGSMWCHRFMGFPDGWCEL